VVGQLPTEPQWSRMESNHRFLGVDQVSSPLDHGTVFLKWSHRESHPDFQRAMLASSCWTMTPCQSQRKPWGSNPQAACLPPPAFQAGSSTIRMASVIILTKAEAVRLELTNGSSPSPVFKTGSSSGRMASIVKLRRLESNQHEDLQSVSSYR
jgi:hypothetical protein